MQNAPPFVLARTKGNYILETSPVFAVIDLYVVVIFKIFLFIALRLLTVTFEFLARGFLRGGGRFFFRLFNRREFYFFVIHDYKGREYLRIRIAK